MQGWWRALVLWSVVAGTAANKVNPPPARPPAHPKAVEAPPWYDKSQVDGLTRVCTPPHGARDIVEMKGQDWCESSTLLVPLHPTEKTILGFWRVEGSLWCGVSLG
jgi:hypothetical protein